MTGTREDERHESLGIDPYEKNWLRVSAALLAVFAIAVVAAGVGFGFQVPGADGRVDPRTVTQPPSPFANPGLRQIAPGEYEVYILAQMWAFTPRDLTIPVGSKVTFYVTSADTQHGFKLQDTNVNMMIVPGHVSKLSATFERAGEYPYICTEYCGAGHGQMFGTLQVVEQGGSQ